MFRYEAQGLFSDAAANHLNSWIAAIELSRFECRIVHKLFSELMMRKHTECLQSIDRFSQLAESDMESQQFCHSAWLQVRVPGSHTWNRYWCVVQAGPLNSSVMRRRKSMYMISFKRQSRTEQADAQQSQEYAPIFSIFRDKKSHERMINRGRKSRSLAMLEFSSVSDAFAIFPRKKALVPLTTLFRVGGNFVSLQSPSNLNVKNSKLPSLNDHEETHGFVDCMAESQDELVVWLESIKLVSRRHQPPSAAIDFFQFIDSFELTSFVPSSKEPLMLSEDDVTTIDMRLPQHKLQNLFWRAVVTRSLQNSRHVSNDSEEDANSLLSDIVSSEIINDNRHANGQSVDVHPRIATKSFVGKGDEDQCETRAFEWNLTENGTMDAQVDKLFLIQAADSVHPADSIPVVKTANGNHPLFGRKIIFRNDRQSFSSDSESDSELNSELSLCEPTRIPVKSFDHQSERHAPTFGNSSHCNDNLIFRSLSEHHTDFSPTFRAAIPPQNFPTFSTS